MNLPFTNVVKAFQRMATRHVKAGDKIIRQGEPGDLFFIIESGRAEVWQQGPYDDEPKLVGVRVPGNHVGDEALVTGGSRNATVRMVTDGTLLVLGKEDFKELISQPMVNEVEIPVAKALAERGYRFLDVRYEEEWEDGHIPGAALLPLTDIRERMDELDRSGKFITYCLSGKRSAVAAMILRANGFETVCMKDGLREWPDQTVTD
jgi:rhodanese-related sulfurtransferase